MKSTTEDQKDRNLEQTAEVKRAYHKPRVTVFGDVQKLTAANIPFTFTDNFVLHDPS